MRPESCEASSILSLKLDDLSFERLQAWPQVLTRATTDAGESVLGNLVADSMRAATEADIAERSLIRRATTG
jgi:hypothetical protein